MGVNLGIAAHVRGCSGMAAMIFAIAFAGITSPSASTADVAFAPGAVLDEFSEVDVLHVEDFEGDGDLDLLVLRKSDNTMRLWLDNGAGYDDVYVVTNFVFDQTIFADMNGDGAQDIVGLRGIRIRMLINDGQATPTFSPVYVELAISSYEIDVGDLDNDGDLDIIASQDGDGVDEVAWYSQPADLNQAWKRRVVDSVAQSPRVTIGDLNGDQSLDIAAFWDIFGDEVAVKWYESDGGMVPTFTQHDIYQIDRSPHFIGAHDMDSDGATDLIVGYINTVAWIRNDAGDGSAWTYRSIYDYVLNVGNCALGDIDQDGDEDVVARSRKDGKVAWYEFVDVATSPFPEHSLTSNSNLFLDAEWIDVGDWEGDGDLDIFGVDYRGFVLFENLTPTLVDQTPVFNDLDGDGINQPGEPGSLTVSLSNPLPLALEDVVVSISSASSNLDFSRIEAALGSVPPAADIEVSFAYLIDAAAVCGSPVTAEVSIDWANGSHQAEASPEWVGDRETAVLTAEDTTGGAIPDNDPTGLVRELVVVSPFGMRVADFTLSLDISHTFRGDLAVNLSDPAATTIPIFEGEDTDSGLSIVGDYPVPQFIGAPAGGTYTLNVIDRVPEDVGTLNSWEISIQGERFICTAWTPTQVTQYLLDELLGMHPPSPALDFNGDGVVDIADLVVRVGGAP